jgi:2-polyprenyl-3-methyl-5-hydroxy-6-metoxy-1,4-benzoquinol methylase
MPTLLLGERRTDLTELMDDPGCDPARLDRTYRHFRVLNRLIAGWGSVYSRWIRPRLLRGPATLVDIGCGGAGVPLMLARWARRDGFDLRATGVDTDERAIAHAAGHDGIELIACDSSDLASAGRTFDFVLSNHLVHHLDEAARSALFRDSERLADCAAIHNDIRRDDLGYAGFWLLGLAFRGSFIRPDGLTSIRRSYTRRELEAALPAGWRCVPIEPFRLLAVHDKPVR